MRRVIAIVIVLSLFPGALAWAKSPTETIKNRETFQTVTIKSSLDDAEQPALFYKPPTVSTPVPLVVSLHFWSTDYKLAENEAELFKWCAENSWAIIHPDFRGRNNNPDATGSKKVVQDIIDAVNYAKQAANIDENRIYLLGGSGGAHAALLMAGKAPHIWAGISAWVPIVDLVQWHEESLSRISRYSREIEASCGGVPGASPEVDRQYFQRSPIHFLSNATGINIDINVGIHDGHIGSVPVSHSFEAFNALCEANGNPKSKVSQTDIDYFVNNQSPPSHLAGETEADRTYPRKIHFRRSAGPVRITVFEGNHEMFNNPALLWLQNQRKIWPKKVTYQHESENFGPMITDIGGPRLIHGPGKSGEIDTMYMMFTTAKGPWFMLALNTNTGDIVQYTAPGSDGMTKSACVGPDDKIYIGSLDGRLLVFDPKHPETGIVNLGEASESEDYPFDLSLGKNGRLYMGSYPNGKLLSYDPKTGKFFDYGRVADDEMYTQSVASFSDEYAYAYAGVTRRRVVRMNLKTGQREELKYPEGIPEPRAFLLHQGVDGKIYSYIYGAEKWCIIEGLEIKVLESGKPRPKYGIRSIPNATFTYDWDNKQIHYKKSDGAEGTWKYSFTGAAAHLFIVRKGIDNVIYGSSAIPLGFFTFDLKTRTHTEYGNPFTIAGGEIYSILPYSPTQVYMGAYGKADFIVYDATKPWKTVKGKAKKEGTNPIYLGILGGEQNRPYDMLKGPDGYVYIATTPNYGQVGGAVTKLDPKTNTWKVHRYPIGNHAISALSAITGNDRIIAGGSIASATGFKRDAFGNAKLFLWDTSLDTVIYRTDPPVAGMQYILQLESTEDGILIGTCGSDSKQLYLFAFDPQKREFIYKKDIAGPVAGYIYEANVFSEPYKGKMYFTDNNTIFTIDTKTYQLEAVAKYQGASKGAVIVKDPGKNNRLACYLLTATDLVAVYLEPEKAP